VARQLAERLGLHYVDSGATYRAAALKVLERGLSASDENAVAEALAQTEIGFEYLHAQPRVLLDGREVTAKIRTPEVTRAAAEVSRLPEVRKKLIALQRSYARGGGVVMEGRDIGTVVFPDAPLKIFLEADPAERARRRLQQEQEQGRPSTLAQTASEIQQRDQLDAERETSPLVPAPDAIRIDSTHLTAGEVVEQILKIAGQRGLIGTWHWSAPGSKPRDLQSEI